MEKEHETEQQDGRPNLSIPHLIRRFPKSQATHQQSAMGDRATPEYHDRYSTWSAADLYASHDARLYLARSMCRDAREDRWVKMMMGGIKSSRQPIVNPSQVLGKSGRCPESLLLHHIGRLASPTSLRGNWRM